MSSTRGYGARLLGEMELEEESLDDFLTTVRTKVVPNTAKSGIGDLDDIWRQHGAAKVLAVTGRGIALLYHMVTKMLTSLLGTVVVLDLTARFSPSHLTCGIDALAHLHIIFPTAGESLKNTLKGLNSYIHHGGHSSQAREWVGTVLVGEDSSTRVEGTDVNVTFGWRGWLRVGRDEVNAFGDGISVEEIWADREQRQTVVEARGWSALCDEGTMRWT